MFSSMLLRARGSLEGSRTGWWVAGIPVGCLDWPLEADRNALHIGQIIHKMKGGRLGVQAGLDSGRPWRVCLESWGLASF